LELEPRKKGIGEILKAERARKGLSLEEAQSGTKISKKFIKAIEADDFVSFPHHVAARGFIRIYSGYLGVASEPLISDFNEKFGSPRQPQNGGVPVLFGLRL
jgi:cytoskeleton protein RodZ